MFAVRSQGRKCGKDALDEEDAKWEVREKYLKKLRNLLYAQIKHKLNSLIYKRISNMQVI